MSSSLVPPNEYVDISTIGLEDVAPNPAPLPCQHGLPSYWLATSKLALEGTHDGPTRLPDSADIVIIGSGITGISTAYHLVRTFPQNTSLCILEARDFCSGATGRNGGHLTAVSALAFSELLANPSHLGRFADHYTADRGSAASSSDVVGQILELEARTVGKLLELVEGNEDEVEHVAGKNWHLCFQQEEVAAFERSLKQAEEAGLTAFTSLVRRVPRHEVDETLRDPQGIVAVYEIPGNTMHPRKLVSFLFQKTREVAKARNIRVEAFAHTPVTQVEQLKGGNGGYRARVHVNGQTIDTRFVVHATNGYASHLIPQFAGPSGVVPTRAQVIAVEPLSTSSREATNAGEWTLVDGQDGTSSDVTVEDGKSRMLWPMGLSAGGGYEYGHQRPTLPDLGPAADQPLSRVKRPLVIFGGGREVVEGREWDVADDSALNPTVSKFLHDWLARTMPGEFQGAKAVQEWTGIMGYTMSKDPFVGPLPRCGSAAGEPGWRSDRVAGQYVSVGYSGHGMSRAYSCAEVVASMMVAEERGQEWKPPRWFPLCYLSTTLTG